MKLHMLLMQIVHPIFVIYSWEKPTLKQELIKDKIDVPKLIFAEFTAVFTDTLLSEVLKAVLWLCVLLTPSFSTIPAELAPLEK